MHRSTPLLAIALFVAPLVLAAQTLAPTDTAQVTNASDAATPSATERSQPRGTRSLMGMVMAALIESAEQSSRQRGTALRQVTPAEATPPAKTRAVLHQDALQDALHEHARTEVAVQADGT
jgi:hypothetical protein